MGNCISVLDAGPNAGLLHRNTPDSSNEQTLFH
jgi:hypothetical protein